MVLHSVMYWQSDSTGSGTPKQVTDSADWDPAGEYEVQERNGTLPQLIGWDSMSAEKGRIEGVIVDTFHKLTYNTWEKADIMYQTPRAGTNCGVAPTTSDASIRDLGPQWFGRPIPLDRDADAEMSTACKTASAVQAGVLYMSYGGRIPYQGGKIIGRELDGIEAGAAPAFGAASTITDLDPRISYRIHGICSLGFEEKTITYGAVKITTPSNSTNVTFLTPAVGDTELYSIRDEIITPYDSLIVQGVETVSVATAASAASKISCIVLFEELGAGTGTSVLGGAGTETNVGNFDLANIFGVVTGGNTMSAWGTGANTNNIMQPY